MVIELIEDMEKKEDIGRAIGEGDNLVPLILGNV